jgi:hypothetical protein
MGSSVAIPVSAGNSTLRVNATKAAASRLASRSRHAAPIDPPEPACYP